MSYKNLSILLVALLAVSCSSKHAGKSENQQPVKTSQEAEKAVSKTEVSEATEVKKEEKQIVFFEKNSAKLTNDAIVILNEQILPVAKKSKIVVEGHCDERGSVAYNQKLGKKRAQAVKNYLVKHGAKAAKIKVVSLGKSKPAELGHTEEAWAKNRRAVTISVKK